MKFVVNDDMDAFLGDTQLSDKVKLRYPSVCHDDVMNLGNGLLCGDGTWPAQVRVIFHTFPAMFEFSSPLLHHTV